jgi:putative transposase
LYRVTDRPTSPGRVRRYPSDTSHAEWALIEPLLPVPACQTALGGRPEKHPRRAIVDAIRYITDNGIKWRALPADFPPWKTVHGFFTRWAKAGVIERVRDRLREQVRLRAGRGAQPSAGAIDSQTVRAAETVGTSTRGYDAGKKIDGRKRHIAVDTMGLLLVVMVSAANLQDRPAARLLLPLLRAAHRGIRLIWADGGYRGTLPEWAKTTLQLTVEIVKKIAGQTSFVVLPRRWVVERTFSWICQARRNVRDYERLSEHSEAFINWSMITMMSRRLARQNGQAKTT